MSEKLEQILTLLLTMSPWSNANKFHINSKHKSLTQSTKPFLSTVSRLVDDNRVNIL